MIYSNLFRSHTLQFPKGVHLFTHPCPFSQSRFKRQSGTIVSGLELCVAPDIKFQKKFKRRSAGGASDAHSSRSWPTTCKSTKVIFFQLQHSSNSLSSFSIRAM